MPEDGDNAGEESGEEKMVVEEDGEGVLGLLVAVGAVVLMFIFGNRNGSGGNSDGPGVL
jgi:hypothetical protein